MINVVSVIVFALIAGTGVALTLLSGSLVWAALGVAVGAVAAMSPKIAQQWERAIVLRLGQFTG